MLQYRDHSYLTTLALARTWARRGELAVRQSLGATTFRIVRQALTENLLLSLPSGAAGLLSGMALTHRLDDIWIPPDPAPQESVPPEPGIIEAAH